MHPRTIKKSEISDKVIRETHLKIGGGGGGCLWTKTVLEGTRPLMISVAEVNRRGCQNDLAF